MKKWASSDNAPLRPRFSCGRTFTVGVLAKRPDHRLGVLWEAGLNLPQTICGFHSPDCHAATLARIMVFVNDEDRQYAKGRILTVTFVAKLTHGLR
jgi:hypothetical protein